MFARVFGPPHPAIAKRLKGRLLLYTSLNHTSTPPRSPNTLTTHYTLLGRQKGDDTAKYNVRWYGVTVPSSLPHLCTTVLYLSTLHAFSPSRLHCLPACKQVQYRHACCKGVERECSSAHSTSICIPFFSFLRHLLPCPFTSSLYHDMRRFLTSIKQSPSQFVPRHRLFATASFSFIPMPHTLSKGLASAR